MASRRERMRRDASAGGFPHPAGHAAEWAFYDMVREMEPL